MTTEELLAKHGLYCHRDCAHRVLTSGLDHHPECPLAYVNLTDLVTEIDSLRVSRVQRPSAEEVERELQRMTAPLSMFSEGDLARTDVDPTTNPHGKPQPHPGAEGQ